MNRVNWVVLRMAVAAMVLGSSSSWMAAQGNPFAPQPAPPLPAGMTGSDANDPRYKVRARKGYFAPKGR